MSRLRGLGVVGRVVPVPGECALETVGPGVVDGMLLPVVARVSRRERERWVEMTLREAYGYPWPETPCRVRVGDGR